MAEKPRPGAEWRSALLAALNAARTARGLAALVQQKDLNPLAQKQARHCAQVGRGTHEGPGGSNWWQRVELSEYDQLASTEVVAEGAPPESLTPAGAVHAWLQSRKGHRQAVLGRLWVHCGLGRVEHGGKVYYVVLFALPAEEP